MTKRFVHPKEGIAARNGDTLSFYSPSTLASKTVYSNPALTTPLLQPVAADMNGMFPSIYMSSELYRVIMLRASGTQVYDEDFYDSGVAAGSAVDGSVLPIALGGTNATNAAAARGQLGAASASTMTTLSTTVSGHDTLIDTGLHSDGDRFGALAKEDTVSPDLMSGQRVCIQHVETATIANSSTSTEIPVDGTNPQAGEGTTLIDTFTFTPQRTDSTIIVRGHGLFLGSASNFEAAMTLVRNAAGNCVASTVAAVPANNRFFQMEFRYRETPGATTPIDYKVMYGVNGGNLAVNGAGSDTMGTTLAQQTYLEIEEWAVP